MPLRFTDETAAVTALEVADGGARLGINGAAGATEAITVAGAVFVTANSRLGANACVSTSVNPVSGSVSVAGGGGTAAVTTNLAYDVVECDGGGTGNGIVSALSANGFTLRNDDPSARTLTYCYW